MFSLIAFLFKSRLQAKICLWKYTEIFHGGFKGIHVRTIGNCLRKKFLQVPKDSQHDYDRLTINIRTAWWSRMGGHMEERLPSSSSESEFSAGSKSSRGISVPNTSPTSHTG